VLWAIVWSLVILSYTYVIVKRVVVRWQRESSSGLRWWERTFITDAEFIITMSAWAIFLCVFITKTL